MCMRCCPCCKPLCLKLTHTVISIIGITLSVIELILAGVYNFTFIGFGLSIIGIITSGFYLWFNIKQDGVSKNAEISDSSR